MHKSFLVKNKREKHAGDQGTFMQRPWDGVSAWNRAFSVSGLKDVFACGERRMTGVDMEKMGIDLTEQHELRLDEKAELDSECAGEAKELCQRHIWGRRPVRLWLLAWHPRDAGCSVVWGTPWVWWHSRI